MSIKDEFYERYNQLPESDSVNAVSETHNRMQHEPNRGCKRCVGEIAEVVLRLQQSITRAMPEVLALMSEVGVSAKDSRSLLRSLTRTPKAPVRTRSYYARLIGNK